MCACAVCSTDSKAISCLAFFFTFTRCNICCGSCRVFAAVLNSVFSNLPASSILVSDNSLHVRLFFSIFLLYKNERKEKPENTQRCICIENITHKNVWLLFNEQTVTLQIIIIHIGISFGLYWNMRALYIETHANTHSQKRSDRAISSGQERERKREMERTTDINEYLMTNLLLSLKMYSHVLCVCVCI